MTQRLVGGKVAHTPVARFSFKSVPPMVAFALTQILGCGGGTSGNGPNGGSNGHGDGGTLVDGRGRPINGSKDGGPDARVVLGAMIAFDGPGRNGHDIYIVRAGESDATDLTRKGGVAEEYAAWSPGGSRLAFGGDELRVMNYPPDGIFTVLASFVFETSRGVIESPSWSPDGSRIVFARHNDNETLDIFTVPSDGSAGPTPIYMVARHKAYSPAWSPDGARIAFILDAFLYAGGPYGIYTMRPDGSELTPVLLGDTGSTRFGGLGALAWSPDGRQLFFTEKGLYGGDGILFIDAMAPGKPVRLIATARKGSPISFSPDGARMAFEVEYPNDWGSTTCCDINAANVDGSGEKTLVSHTKFSSSILRRPAWYPGE